MSTTEDIAATVEVPIRGQDQQIEPPSEGEDVASRREQENNHVHVADGGEGDGTPSTSTNTDEVHETAAKKPCFELRKLFREGIYISPFS